MQNGKKRLYLINPDNPLVSVVNSKLNRWNQYTVWKPLGLLIIAGLTPDEWEIEVFDENVRHPDYENLPAPDLVGITAFTSQAERAYHVAAHFRAAGVAVVMGGIHVTMCPAEAGQYADAIVTGEAESVWAQVLADSQQGRLQPVYEGQRLDMRKVPAARHDLLPTGYRFGSLQTTRGCPLNCHFCSVSAFNGRKYRHRHISGIVEEYRMIREKYVLIVDDNFIGTRKDHIAHTKKLLQAMIDSGVKKKWIAQVTINFGDDDELLRLAAAAGCIGVFIGFESTTPEGLEEIHKKFNIRSEEDTRAAIDRIHRYGIAVVGSFIIGLDVDKAHIGETIASTAHRLGIDALNLMFLTPLPGTDLWKEMEADDRILLHDFPGDWKYYTLTFPVARYNHLSWDRMLAEKHRCYRSFYSYAHIAARVWATVRQKRNTPVTLLSNLWYRNNTLRLDRRAYEGFDTTPGKTPLCREDAV
jgi:radical SAM superfamily enzyme YgiQ (UPF0313 family)